MVGIGLLLHRLLRAVVLEGLDAVRSTNTAGACGAPSSSCRCPGSPSRRLVHRRIRATALGHGGRVADLLRGLGPDRTRPGHLAHLLRHRSIRSCWSSWSMLMVKAIKAGPKDNVALLNGEPDPMETPHRSNRPRRAPSPRPQNKETRTMNAIPIDYETLRLIWWACSASADRLCHHGRNGSGRRRAVARRCADRRGAPRACSTCSGRHGKATRSGWSSAAARSLPRSRRSMRSAFRASISR